MSFDIGHRQLGPFFSYDFAALSVWRSAPCSRANPCVDAIPNKYPLLRHDFTAPTAKWTSAPIFSTDVTDIASFPVSFIVKDDRNGSGVKHWTLQYRIVAGAGWTTADSGSSASATVLVPGQEGATVDYRLKMVDKQGNARISDPRSTVVPFDDRNSVFVYTSGSPITNDSVSGAFLGTTSSIASGTTFTATMPGMSDKKLCIVGGPTASSASLQLWIGGVQRFTFWEGASTPEHDTICSTGAGFSGAGTITLVGGSSDFVFDGFAIKP